MQVALADDRAPVVVARARCSTPDILFARAPLSVFNWSYGQLLNFNGLTHAVLLIWPIVASVFLFALAGRPGWGEPSSGI